MPQSPLPTPTLLSFTQAARKNGSWIEVKHYSWQRFCQMLARDPAGILAPKPAQLNYTAEQYAHLDKATKLKIKDVGCYLFGRVANKRRRSKDIISRSAIVLDIDKYSNGSLKDLLTHIRTTLDKRQIQWLCYPSLSHRPDHICLRIVVPMAVELQPDAYAPACRQVMAWIDPTLEMFDVTAAQANRMFYLPAITKGSRWFVITGANDAPFVAGNDILAELGDWSDPDSWPRKADERTPRIQGAALKTDVEDLPGLQGTVCRALSIYDVLNDALSDIWSPGEDDRWSYVDGSSTDGGVVIDDWLLYSFHESDPYHERALNAFEAVQLYKFGDLDGDIDADTPLPERKASLAAASEYFVTLEPVRTLKVSERQQAAHSPDFANAGHLSVERAFDKGAEDEARAPLGRDPGEGVRGVMLRHDKTGSPVSSIASVGASLYAMDDIYPALGYNAMTQTPVWVRPINASGLRIDVPDVLQGRAIDDGDLMALAVRIDAHIGPGVRKNVAQDAVLGCASRNTFHPVQIYLEALPEWDGTPRVASALHRHLNCRDDDYTAACSTLLFKAAVKRALEPGCKYDQLVVLGGREGIGKSRFCRLLMPRDDWFSDSAPPIRAGGGSAIIEATSGCWLIEFSELVALGSRSDGPDAIKAFLSRGTDSARLPYARTTSHIPRAWVGIGTTNAEQYLVSRAGNRRFIPVECAIDPAFVTMDADALVEERDQLWAEAMALLAEDDNLRVSGAFAEAAHAARKGHRVVDEAMLAKITTYLEENEEEGAFTPGLALAGAPPGDDERHYVSCEQLLEKLFLIAHHDHGSHAKKMRKDITYLMDQFAPGWVRGTYAKRLGDLSDSSSGAYSRTRTWWQKTCSGEAQQAEFEAMLR